MQRRFIARQISGPSSPKSLASLPFDYALYTGYMIADICQFFYTPVAADLGLANQNRAPLATHTLQNSIIVIGDDESDYGGFDDGQSDTSLLSIGEVFH